MPHRILDPLDMPTPQPLDFTAELKVTTDLSVGQDSKAVDNGRWLSDHLHQLVRIKSPVSLVPHGQNDCIRPFKSFRQALLDPELCQLVLIAEEPCQGMSRGRIAVLLFKLPPVLDIRIVDTHLAPISVTFRTRTSEPEYLVSPTSSR